MALLWVILMKDVLNAPPEYFILESKEKSDNSNLQTINPLNIQLGAQGNEYLSHMSFCQG